MTTTASPLGAFHYDRARLLTCVGLLAAPVYVSGCGSSDDGEDEGIPELALNSAPVCRTVDLTNTVAVEKVNAAICLGIAYNDAYSCNFNLVDNATYCTGISSGYWVQWAGIEYGDVYDANSGTFMARITQSSTGEYVIDWADGDYGECSVIGDIARLCVY